MLGPPFIFIKEHTQLLAVCDAHYRLGMKLPSMSRYIYKYFFHPCRFIIVDVGDTGRHSDGGVFSNSAFEKHLKVEPSQSQVHGLSLVPLRHLFHLLLWETRHFLSKRTCCDHIQAGILLSHKLCTIID